MHFSLILLVFSVAWSIRVCGCSNCGTWTDRWQRSLVLFLFAPLLFVMTAIAILAMGTQGQMLGLPVGWVGYSLALGFFTVAGGMGLGLTWQGWRSLQQLQTYPLITVAHTAGRLVDVSEPIAAQVGFWQSELLVSQGLLDLLSAEQLDAVLTHEQAHYHYRDTFWFFWLGWVRSITIWLPQTASLWEELLLLRELRADRWAAQRVDPLLLAESLLLVVKSPLIGVENYCAAFSATTSIGRLEQRIEALMTLQPSERAEPSGRAEPSERAEPFGRSRLTWQWALLPLSFLPLLTMLFHR